MSHELSRNEVAMTMERAAVDGLELEYELRGSGEPVVLIHWGLCAAWAEPLMDEPALAERHRLLHYHRAGFARSDRIEGPISIAEHATHCAALMRHLGTDRAHIVGHSSSAAIALQLALDFPDAVATLALMEPARPVPPTDEQALFVRDVVAPAIEHYRAGDKAGAVETFASGVFGSDYRDPLEQGLPGFFEQSVADADAFFAEEHRFPRSSGSLEAPHHGPRPRRTPSGGSPASSAGRGSIGWGAHGTQAKSPPMFSGRQ